jgi:hypothetical protein
VETNVQEVRNPSNEAVLQCLAVAAAASVAAADDDGKELLSTESRTRDSVEINGD